MDEVEKGLEQGYQEVLLIRKFVEEGLIVIRRAKNHKKTFGLHPGELSVIQLAKKMKIKELIVDDRKAISVAKYFGLKVVSTPYLLLKSLKAKKITYEEFKDSFEGLIGLGYFISPDLYIRILERARDF
jgi:predicted nucleic acid-binding protein